MFKKAELEIYNIDVEDIITASADEPFEENEGIENEINRG